MARRLLLTAAMYKSNAIEAVDAEPTGGQPRAPGKRTLTDRLQRRATAPAARPAPVTPRPTPEAPRDESFAESLLREPIQRAARTTAPDDVHARAAAGIAGPATPLPFLEQIQAAFGPHEVRHIAAHTDAAAADATAAIGATAYATGHHVAFGGTPDLHTAAHEAAHVVQQRGGVHLAGGVGAAGDVHERHADAVADRVVAGASAADLLAAYGDRGGSAALQRQPALDDDLELGPAGAPTSGAAPAPGAGPPIDTVAMVKAAIPVIKGALDAIRAVQAVNAWINPRPEGQSGALPSGISTVQKDELQRALHWEIATAYLDAVFTRAKSEGVDLDRWQDGHPPPDLGPPGAAAGTTAMAAAAGQPLAGLAQFGATTAATAPAPPAGPALPDEVTRLADAVRRLWTEDLKLQAEQRLAARFAHVTTAGDPPAWWWAETDDHGFGEPPMMLKAMHTWAKVQFVPMVAALPDGVMVGIPERARHLGLPTEAHPSHAVTWFVGGFYATEVHEATWDDLEVTAATPATFDANAVQPLGEIMLTLRYEWDDSVTHASFVIGYAPAARMGYIASVEPRGTPDD